MPLMNALTAPEKMEAAVPEPAATPLSPQAILDAAYGFAVTRVLTTAVELDIFTSIVRGQTTLEALCRETSCSTRGLSMLLNALTALKYLESKAGSLRPGAHIGNLPDQNQSAVYRRISLGQYGYILVCVGTTFRSCAQRDAVQTAPRRAAGCCILFGTRPGVAYAEC